MGLSKFYKHIVCCVHKKGFAQQMDSCQTLTPVTVKQIHLINIVSVAVLSPVFVCFFEKLASRHF